jgi:hypothetical protein
MAIYRGPGGPGDAVADAASEAALISALVTQAQTAETNAGNSASAAGVSASSASASASNAASSASTASTAASNAASSASAASTSASNASTSATNASNSASAASTSASNAATSETNAANSASAAATSATNASNSASAAATSASNAAASYDAFDDRYLGAKSSAPTLDNDGNALLTGALYWNTVGNQLYVWDGSAWDAAAFDVTGSAVTSVAMTVPTGLTVSGSPVTSTGTLAVTYTAGYAIPTTTKQSNWDDSYTFVSNFPTQTGNSGKYLTTDGSTLSWGTLNTTNWDTAYSWGNHATAGYLTSYTETDPVVGAINGIVKANGSGTISAATAGTDYLAPAAIGVTVQAYDAGLQSIAGLTTAANKMIYTTALDTYAVADLTAAGRALLDDADAATQRTTLGLVIGTNVQAYDAGLQSIAGLTTAADRMIYTTASDTYAVTTLTAAGRAILDDADASAQRTTLGLVIGTDVQAYDSNLTSFVNTFTLPTTDGTNGQVLQTNGSGTLSFTTPTGGGITTGKAIAMAIVFG